MKISFPLIIRAPGFHTGYYCERVETLEQLQTIVSSWSFEKYILSEFLDLRAGDGFVRKYRFMSIDGQLYPLHLAASSDWKVHYLTSAMAHESKLRAEEADFLSHPETTLGPTAWSALQRITQILGLDYGGIDFGLDTQGQLIVFEANATMIVPVAPAHPRWDYRRMAPVRIHAAVEQLISQTARRAKQPKTL